MIVSAPASSANLGPGFDCLALAVDLPFELCDEPEAVPDWPLVEPTHPAAVAHEHAGGDPALELRWRSPIPPGRGLGFSGAARVAGAFLAGVRDGLDGAVARRASFVVASRLEGHADNAAASAFGGLTVAAGGEALSVPVPHGLSVLAWSPDAGTSTDASRRHLDERVPLDDAADSIARAALWVAAMSTGELSVLRTACQDRVHQTRRLASRADAAAALEAALGEPDVLAAWLSGSGPTVAALVPRDAPLDDLDDRLARTGRVRRLDIDAVGVRRSG